MIRVCKCGYADGVFAPKCKTPGHGTKYMIRKGSGLDFVCTGCGQRASLPHYCPECKKEKAWDTDRFIMEAKKVHGDKYDYSQVEYVNNSTEVTIKCNECGTVFKQKPS